MHAHNACLLGQKVMAHGMDLQLWERVLSPCIWVIRRGSVLKMALWGQTLYSPLLLRHACGWLT